MSWSSQFFFSKKLLKFIFILKINHRLFYSYQISTLSYYALNYALPPFHKIAALSNLQAQLLLNLVLSEWFDL